MKDFAEVNIVSAKKQLLDAQSRKLDSGFDGGTFYGVSLSARGYKKLGVHKDNTPADVRFLSGMAKNYKQLSDKPDAWEAGLKEGNIDALIIVTHSQLQEAISQCRKIENETGVFAKVLLAQKGQVLRNEHNLGIEHFGYVDGVSQPLFLKDEIAAQSNYSVWQDQASLNLILVKDKGGKYADSYGSYLVFRKLEQNVLDFKRKETEISEKFNGGNGIKDRNGNPNGELAGAMLVGRFENGSEVITNSSERHITKEEELSNDFNYKSDNAELRCPYHAHIRLTNPRADVANPETVKNSRITRRGIPYNDINRDTNDLENDRPTHGVGLLFMCYQANIQNQFEAIQIAANKGTIDSAKVGQDAVIGQGSNNDKKELHAQWGKANHPENVTRFHGVVTNKGGEYFFTPSISFLKSL